MNKIVSILLLLLVAPSALAGLEVNFSDEDEGCFGNAKTEAFRRSIEGDVVLSAVDKAFLANIEANRLGNRWRLKAFVGRPRMNIEDVEVTSIGADTVEITGIGPGVSKDTFQLFLGWGYKWTRWATDLEFLAGEQLSQPLSPATFSTPITFVSQFNTTFQYLALFWNLEYEIPRFLDFIPNTIHPYIQGGAGIAVKSANSDILVGTDAMIHISHDIVTFAWNAGLGFRFEITCQLLGDIAYRWVDLGGLNTGTLEGAVTDPFALLSASSKHVKSRGLYFGITYQL